MSMQHVFSGNPLDRGEAFRRDEDRLKDAIKDPTSRFLPLWNLNVLVADTEQGSELAWLLPRDIERLEVREEPVLLGLRDGVAHFAIDVSAVDDPAFELNLPDFWRFREARTAAMGLPMSDTGILAQAKAHLDWHRRHAFCSVCGARSAPERGGQVRICPECGAEHFPRTDPVAIMLVIDSQGDRCLLGQSHGPLVKIGMFSTLAGFIDQGESIEEAVRREVMEEAGIEAGAVFYHSSQPWPFPSSLMIGCHAYARSTDINFDEHEMHDVRWVERADVITALEEAHPTLKVPGEMAIAHHLLKAWVNDEVPRP